MVDEHRCEDCPIAHKEGKFGFSPPPDDILSQFSRIQRYRAGQLIVEQQQPVDGWWVVRSGRAEIFLMDEHGRKHLVRVVGPGDLLGTCALKGLGNYCYSARALDPEVEACRLPLPAIPVVLSHCPGITQNILAEMAQDLALSYRKMHRLATKSARARLAHQLLDLMENNPVSRKHAVLPVPRQQLADMIGVSLETAVRALTHLKEEGWVDTRGRDIVVLDVDGLKSVAQSE